MAVQAGLDNTILKNPSLFDVPTFKWYTTEKNQKLNPAYLLAIPDNLKDLFKYIIGGWEHIDDTVFEGKLADLVKFYTTMSKKDVKESELLLFDLIHKANELEPLKLKTQFLKEGVRKLDSPTYIDDFNEHFPTPQLRGIYFDLCIGINDDTFNHNQFIDLLKGFITPSWLNRLNDLRDTHETNTHNTVAKYEYRLKISHSWIHIALAILDLLEKTGDDKKDKISDCLSALLHGLPFVGDVVQSITPALFSIGDKVVLSENWQNTDLYGPLGQIPGEIVGTVTELPRDDEFIVVIVNNKESYYYPSSLTKSDIPIQYTNRKMINTKWGVLDKPNGDTLSNKTGVIKSWNNRNEVFFLEDGKQAEEVYPLDMLAQSNSSGALEFAAKIFTTTPAAGATRGGTKTGGIFDYIQKNMPLNKNGQNLPKVLFKDVKDKVNVYFNSGMANAEKISYIRYFIKTFDLIFTNMGVVHLESPENMYDLFDSINLETNTDKTYRIDKKGKKTDKYPLRTFHFRNDTLINKSDEIKINDSFTGKPYPIPINFREALDIYCYHSGKSLNIFNGIIQEADHIGAFHDTIQWEINNAIPNTMPKDSMKIINKYLSEMKTAIDYKLAEKCIKLDINIPVSETSIFPKYYYRIYDEDSIDEKNVIKLISDMSDQYKKTRAARDTAIKAEEAQKLAEKAKIDKELEAQKAAVIAAKKAEEDAKKDAADKKVAKEKADAEAKQKLEEGQAVALAKAQKTAQNANMKTRKAASNADYKKKEDEILQKAATNIVTATTLYNKLKADDKAKFDKMHVDLAAVIATKTAEHQAALAKIAAIKFS